MIDQPGTSCIVCFLKWTESSIESVSYLLRLFSDDESCDLLIGVQCDVREAINESEILMGKSYAWFDIRISMYTVCWLSVRNVGFSMLLLLWQMFNYKFFHSYDHFSLYLLRYYVSWRNEITIIKYVILRCIQIVNMCFAHGILASQIFLLKNWQQMQRRKKKRSWMNAIVLLFICILFIID